MGITFEECYGCGKHWMRKEARLGYNPSKNEFYYIWECFSCNYYTYDIIEFKDMENAESKKIICEAFQDWNERATIYNQKLRKYNQKLKK